jgi:uncharacterized membrane protein
VLHRVSNDFVPNLGATVAGLLLFGCIVVFLIFLDRFLHRLRPVAVADLVSHYVQRDFGRYQAAFLASPDIFLGVFDARGERPAAIARSDRPGAIQAVDIHGLARWGRQHERLVVVRHTIGDFVPTGAILIEVYGGPPDESVGRKLGRMVILAVERTVEQDPAFAMRIMVDIADKALSPAINDPTTAVQVLNLMGDVLRVIGASDLSRSVWKGDEDVRSGLVIPVRRWEDYLSLAMTEIREYGSSSIQVMRRMRALLEELYEEVRPEHQAAIEEELHRLDVTVARTFGDSIDSDRAGTADVQGIGGRTDAHALLRRQGPS